MSRVYMVPCGEYTEVPERLRELFELMGGIENFAKRGEKVVLKPNLLLAASPEKAATTHPALVAATGRLVREAGARTLLADSPGSGFRYNPKTLEKVYGLCGMNDAAEAGGIALNRDVSYRTLSYSEGRLTKRFEIIMPLLEADGVINLCKMKTHSFMGMTGAVKNMFGAIPGFTKPGYHAKLRDPSHFAGMLLDLCECLSPRLSIMDAVTAMEGNGPHAGEPRRVGLLVASESPLALDLVASEIMGMPRSRNPVIREAERRGLEPRRVEDVEIVGAQLDDFKMGNFRLPKSIGGTGFGPMSWIAPVFRRGLNVEPRVFRERCTSCGVCARACPVGAITVEKKSAALIDHGLCIRCYCCHEMCPEEAIRLQRGTLYRLIRGRTENVRARSPVPRERE